MADGISLDVEDIKLINLNEWKNCRGLEVKSRRNEHWLVMMMKLLKKLWEGLKVVKVVCRITIKKSKSNIVNSEWMILISGN